MADDTNQDKQPGCFLYAALGSLGFALVADLIFPKLLPFEMFEFWALKGSLWAVIKSSWIAFAWGAGLTTLVSVFTRNSPQRNQNAEAHYFVDVMKSAVAGLFEEISFRWCFFYGSIVTLQIFNFLVFGFLGFGIPEWVYQHVFGPLADFTTLHYLHEYLFNGYGWAVGAAIVAANGRFRNGHVYLGPLGFVNSWFMGMFFFYIMFHYGLIAAMIVHFLYDFFIFSVSYVDAVIERALGWGTRSQN